MAAHVYEDGYTLVEVMVLDGSTLKEKSKETFNFTAALFGMTL